MDNLYFASATLGILTGISWAIGIIKLDSGFKQLFGSVSFMGIILGEFWVIFNFFNVENLNKSIIFTIFIISALLCFILTLIIVVFLLSKQTTSYKINFFEILLGLNNIFKDYVEAKKNELIKPIENEKKEIDRRLEELENAERKHKTQKEKLQKIEERILKAKKNISVINLPKNYTLPTDEVFINCMPNVIHNFVNFSSKLDSFTKDFIQSNTNNSYVTLKAYLMGLSGYIGEYLFNSQNIRIHFRQYDKCADNYVKLLIIENNQSINTNLTPMPNDGIIKECTKIKKSIVRSLNEELHIEGNNDHIWKDYITIVFNQLKIDENNCLTLTISTKNPSQDSMIFYILNYICFEQIIENYLLLFNNKFSIIETLYEGRTNVA
ncbi:CHASE3 domain-containing protein [Aliarcobacter butzleri]|uniref:CHASE3 domain-containing protein n=1 Tax=Aliarcobacter butzleri TaxID=28197 RepID=UPI00263D00E8|nr:hypothetical protein [Aliarcobacter butzleri]MDN5049657.1 hypothetical protein [Aliarcobacter butzleri]MDN5056540.1 hypothetical protein [Aliarcobacter butzleri]